MNQLTLRLLLMSVIVYLVYLLMQHASFYTRPYDHLKLAQIYNDSQYVTGSGSKGIGDDGLYSFAGYYYISGGDPSQVNFENPPLGKYLIGVSVIFFKNENVIYIIYAFLTFIGVYILTYSLYKNQLLGALSVILLGVSNLFLIQFLPTDSNQLSVTLLDLPLTVFFLWGIIFFLKANQKPNMYMLSALFLGLAFSTKFFPALIILLPLFAAYQFVIRKKAIKMYLLSLIIIPTVYLVSYAMYFFYHPSLIEFINYQRYMINWRLGNPVVWGNIFRTVSTGTYKSWWDNTVLTDQEWTRMLPIIVSFAIIGGIMALRKKDHPKIFLLIVIILFLGYLAVGSVGVARYIMPIYPLLIILAVEVIQQVFFWVRHTLYDASCKKN